MLRDTFFQLDKNGDGTLSFDEIKLNCFKLGVPLPPNFADVFKLILWNTGECFRCLDSEETGFIHMVISDCRYVSNQQ